jgi:hypothetical protein
LNQYFPERSTNSTRNSPKRQAIANTVRPKTVILLAEIGLDKIVDCRFVVDDQNMELTGSWYKYYHNGIFYRCSLPVIVEAMKACANCCAQWLKQWGIGD